MKKYIYILLAFCLVCASCSKDDTTPTVTTSVAKAYVSLDTLSATNLPSAEDYWVIEDEDSLAKENFEGLFAALTSLETSSREITIEFANLTYLPEYCFSDAPISLVSVVAPEVIELGEGIFAGSKGLKELYLDKALVVGEVAIYCCPVLEYVYLPKATEMKEYGMCWNVKLNQLYIPKLETIEDYGLSYNYALETISAPELLEAHAGAFYENNLLKSVNMPKLDSLGCRAFANCYSLEDITLKSLTKIDDEVFYFCTSLEYVSMPLIKEFNGWTFSWCYNLKTVNLPVLETIGDGDFCSCVSLESVNYPNVTSAGGSAFEYCYSLVSISMPKLTELNDYVFSDCTALRELEVATSGSPLTYVNKYALSGTPSQWVTLTVGSVEAPVSILENTLSDSDTGYSQTFAQIITQ
ncbi:MAG: leucine-rich repeat domain-containing protein [Rikenellaceae bacterium]